MFYYPNVLQRHTGCFSTIWLAATRGSKIVKREYLKVNVINTCQQIMQYILQQIPAPYSGAPVPRFSLYLSAQLSYGVVCVFHRQCDLLIEEMKSTLERLYRAEKQMKIDLLQSEQQALLPDALSAMQMLEAAPDPFFGMMGITPELPDPLMIPQIRLLLETPSPERMRLEITPPRWKRIRGREESDHLTSPESITLREVEPVTLPSIELMGDIPEASARDIEFLMSDLLPFPEEETLPRPSGPESARDLPKDTDRAVPKKPRKVQPKEPGVDREQPREADRVEPEKAEDERELPKEAERDRKRLQEAERQKELLIEAKKAKERQWKAERERALQLKAEREIEWQQEAERDKERLKKAMKEMKRMKDTGADEKHLQEILKEIEQLKTSQKEKEQQREAEKIREQLRESAKESERLQEIERDRERIKESEREIEELQKMLEEREKPMEKRRKRTGDFLEEEESLDVVRKREAESLTVRLSPPSGLPLEEHPELDAAILLDEVTGEPRLFIEEGTLEKLTPEQVSPILPALQARSPQLILPDLPLETPVRPVLSHVVRKSKLVIDKETQIGGRKMEEQMREPLVHTQAAVPVAVPQMKSKTPAVLFQSPTYQISLEVSEEERSRPILITPEERRAVSIQEDRFLPMVSEMPEPIVELPEAYDTSVADVQRMRSQIDRTGYSEFLTLAPHSLSRISVSRLFFNCLVLCSQLVIHLEQAEPYGPILITPGPCYSPVSMTVSTSTAEL